MRLLVLCLFFVITYANAFFAYGNLGDSRLQSENNVYRPAGIVSYTVGVGVFDEPESIIDYKMSFGFTRSGYSYNDGNESVSLYILDLNLISWSVTVKKVYFEAYCGLSYLLKGTNFSDYMERKVGEEFIDQERIYPKYGYRLGYYVMDNLLVGVTANYNMVHWRYGKTRSWAGNNNESLFIGGIGLSVLYNIF
jgi:hypothetical protein